MISPQDLRYFMEIARTQHLSRAAERLALTQPTLTHSLQKMESTLGSALFLRSKKGMTLTPAGTRLFEKAEKLTQLWDDTLRSVQDEMTEASGRIRLGCHSAVAQYTLPLFLPQLFKEYPKLNVQLSHGLSRHMTEMVVSSLLDVAIVVNPTPHPDLIMKEICRDEVTIWTAKNCKNKDVLMIEPNLVQTQSIVQKMRKKGLDYQRLIESPSLEVLSQLVSSGAGHAILPGRIVHAFASEKSIEAVPGAPVFEDKVFVIYQREFRKQKRGEVFLESLINAFERK